MHTSQVAKIIGSDMSVSDKIRALADAGHPRADIARLLGKRDQHVRNVLEADKLHPRPAVRRAAHSETRVGLEEASRTFQGVLRLEVEPGGIVLLPPECMAALGVAPGGVLFAVLDEDRLVYR